MIRKLLPPALSLFLGLIAVSATARAQVTVIPGSGCPTANAPSHQPTARIGTNFTFGDTCPAPRVAFAIFGLPTSKLTVSFNSPITCTPGPCVWALEPFAGTFYEFPTNGQIGNWVLPIPNVPGLVGTTWGIQTGCICT